MSNQVVEFLTTEFYAVNYSLRQRLDVLEVRGRFVSGKWLLTFSRLVIKRTPPFHLYQVLALSAQELSQPITEQGRPPRGAQPTNAVIPLDQNAPPLHWRQVVEQRIQSKTRRFAKVRLRPPLA